MGLLDVNHRITAKSKKDGRKHWVGNVQVQRWYCGVHKDCRVSIPRRTGKTKA
jgi:hypothetical protein